MYAAAWRFTGMHYKVEYCTISAEYIVPVTTLIHNPKVTFAKDLGHWSVPIPIATANFTVLCRYQFLFYFENFSYWQGYFDKIGMP